MTLPSISPVLLFAVVIGVIDGLQYFTQAYVAANDRGRLGVAAPATVATNLGYPENSTLFYPVLLYQQAFQILQHGLRVGDGDAAARRLVRGRAG